MQTLTLKSVVRGRVSSYVWRTAWILAFVALVFYLHHLGGNAKDALNNDYGSYADNESVVLWTTIGAWVSGIIAAIITLTLIFANLEDAEFEVGTDGYWHTLTRRSRNLFGAVGITTIVIDEITAVGLHQTNGERRRNTGTLSVTLLKYHGTRTESTSLYFLAIENPEAARQGILAHLPPSKGLSMALNMEDSAD